MKKLSKIRLQNAVVLEEREMKAIYGGSGSSGGSGGNSGGNGSGGSGYEVHICDCPDGSTITVGIDWDCDKAVKELC